MNDRNQTETVFIDNEAVYELESKFCLSKSFWIALWIGQILIIVLGFYLVSKVY